MNIKHLIKKFYEGDSTPEEERYLTTYFLNEDNVDEHLKEDQQVFRLLHDIQIQIPARVSIRLEKAIFLRADKTDSSRYNFAKKIYYWISSAAAIVFLCIGLFFATREPSVPKMADTFSDPKEAALVAEQTLAYISAHLNNGLNKVADAEHEFEKVNQLLNKHLNK